MVYLPPSTSQGYGLDHESICRCRSSICGRAHAQVSDRGHPDVRDDAGSGTRWIAATRHTATWRGQVENSSGREDRCMRGCHGLRISSVQELEGHGEVAVLGSELFDAGLEGAELDQTAGVAEVLV